MSFTEEQYLKIVSCYHSKISKSFWKVKFVICNRPHSGIVTGTTVLISYLTFLKMSNTVYGLQHHGVTVKQSSEMFLSVPS